MINPQRVSRFISDNVVAGFDASDYRRVGGGCINDCLIVEDKRRRFFVKTNRPQALAAFEAERLGLELLRQNPELRVPEPFAHGVQDDTAILVMEALELGSVSAAGAARLGAGLAAQHRIVAPEFGLSSDNFIGATPQTNSEHPDWILFYKERRLGPQLDFAQRNGCPSALRERGERLLEYLPALFDGYTPRPSLLHGDLWSGNSAETVDGAPAIFDPAVYFGDREADIAMTELFGRLPAAFYQAYEHAWPLDPGYAARRTLYNLYHILNHFNLFGGGYAAQAQAMTEALLAETGG